MPTSASAIDSPMSVSAAEFWQRQYAIETCKYGKWLRMKLKFYRSVMAGFILLVRISLDTAVPANG